MILQPWFMLYLQIIPKLANIFSNNFVIIYPWIKYERIFSGDQVINGKHQVLMGGYI